MLREQVIVWHPTKDSGNINITQVCSKSGTEYSPPPPPPPNTLPPHPHPHPQKRRKQNNPTPLPYVFIIIFWLLEWVSRNRYFLIFFKAASTTIGLLLAFI